MNYFEFYNIPINLKINAADLKKKFYKKSMELHPDRLIDSEQTELEILELSAMNNLAYKTLKDFSKRLKYILDLKNSISETDQLPKDFLMEMMNINEQIMELQFDYDPKVESKVLAEVAGFEKALAEEIKDILDMNDLDLKSIDLMDRMKSHHYKNKYLKRIKENLAKISAQHSDNS